MKIIGNSKQDGIPKPDNPVQITNETVLIITDKEGNKKEMPFKYEKILKEGDKIEKINGEWCLVRRKPMNDIEILEDIISGYKAIAIEWKFGNVPVHLDERDIEAIENLIQRNKDLEEIEKEHKKENGRLREELGKIEYIKRSFDYCLEQKTKELEKQFNTTEIEQGTEGQKRIKAIESLIQRNKELEMQNKEFLTRLKADGLIERDKYWINKIKENIKMLDKEEKKALKGTKGQDRYSIKLEYMHKRNVLQELLEESDK